MKTADSNEKTNRNKQFLDSKIYFAVLDWTSQSSSVTSIISDWSTVSSTEGSGK